MEFPWKHPVNPVASIELNGKKGKFGEIEFDWNGMQWRGHGWTGMEQRRWKEPYERRDQEGGTRKEGKFNRLYIPAREKVHLIDLI